MLKFLRRFIDYFVPLEDKTSAVENRKGRFFVSILLFTWVVCIFNVIYFLNLDVPNVLAATGSGFGFILTIVMVLMHRKIGRRTLFINIFNVLSYGMVGALAYSESGGIYSSDIVFMIISSAWTYLLAGKRSGFIWFLISFLMIVFYYVMEVTHPGPSPFLEALLKLPPDYNLMNYGTVCWFLLLIVAMHQKNNDTYLEEIHEKQGVIEQKNKEILDSIGYAKRLQEAILPPMEHVKEVFNDFFIFYKPKDIVAGDFYWMERRDQHVFFAVADCTGHGVPGAMVSVVCSNALNHALREFKLTEPGEILDKVSELVQDTFAKSGGDVHDGMDISLMVIDTRSRNVKWSGANNGIWKVQDNVFSETRGDKQPVGRFEYRKRFTTHEFTVKSGDVVYLFTDGFADQFGGPKGKKFKYKQLQKLLMSVHDQPMNQQEKQVGSALNKWQGNLEQVDDICVTGVRFN